MIPREFFNNASPQDLRLIREWTLGVSAVFSILALTLVLLSFVVHQSNSTTSASNASEANQAILVRD
jgi:hypothetical protein